MRLQALTICALLVTAFALACARARDKKLLTLSLLTPLLVAGCLGGGEPVGVEQTPTVVDDAGGAPGGGAAPTTPLNATSPGATPPAWAPGAWWTYRFDYGDESDTVTIAVQQATTREYAVLPDNEGIAIYDAVLDVSFIGPIATRDLSGSQNGQAVQFYQWPLEDGATWATTWDGLQVTITARAANLTTPSGNEAGFALTATTEDGETYAAYDYAPSVGWWTQMTFGNTTNDGMFLQDHGFGYDGPLVDAVGEEAYANGHDGTVADASAFTIQEGATHVVAVAGGGGAAFAEAVEIVDAAHNVHGFTTPPCALCGNFRLEIMDAVPGEWHVAVAGGGPPGMAGYMLQVHEVALVEAAVQYA